MLTYDIIRGKQLNSRKTTKLIYISGNEKCSKIGKHRGVRAATAPPSRPRMNLLMFGRGCRRRFLISIEGGMLGGAWNAESFLINRASWLPSVSPVI